ncbi:MAG: substrate-binding domain-containing protein [Lacisediminihabitans sp.]
MALGIASALRALGRRHIAIMNWDESMFCRIATPSITSLARFPEEQGRRSTRMLLDVLARANPADGIALPSELIVRETSVRPRRHPWPPCLSQPVKLTFSG